MWRRPILRACLWSKMRLKNCNMSSEKNPANLPSLKQIVQIFELNAKKSLGQNFILDENVNRKIISGAGDLSGKMVVEIGPGPGGLTREILAQNPKKLIVIEKDSRCIDALKFLGGFYENIDFEIREEDALKLDYAGISDDYIIISNLPYNISTKLLTKWLHVMHSQKNISAMHLMFQHEVAQRIVSEKNKKSYGRLSVLSQLVTHARIVLTLPPSVFTPAPKIDSSVVNFVQAKNFEGVDLKATEELLRAAFANRRKMLRSNLKNILDGESLQKYGQLRAEDLSLSDFVSLIS